MCYCEFGDIIKDIERLDADVISIENSRSNNQTLREITSGGYSHQVGNGVYDIHSPVVPTTEQILQQLRTGVANLPVKQIWVNPGFQEQLVLYELCQYAPSQSNGIYVSWRHKLNNRLAAAGLA